MNRTIALIAVLAAQASAVQINLAGLKIGIDTAIQAEPDYNPLSEHNRPMTVCATAWLTVAALLIWIYKDRGFKSCASILIYVFTLSIMSVLIRNCYVVHNFKYPQFVTATHFVATALVGCSILTYRYFTTGQCITVPDVNCLFKGLMPVAFFFVLSLGAANNGLLFANAHFYEMVGHSGPLVTASMSLLLGRGFDFRLSSPLVLITAAMFVVTYGELEITLLGFICCFGAVVLRSAKSMAQHSLMGGSEWKSMDPVEVAVWTSTTCFFLMLSWSVVSEGATPWKQIMAWEPFMAVLATCAAAATLNIAALFVLKDLGPVAQQIVGQLKILLSILAAVAVFGEVISTQQAIGYAFLLLGIAWYNKKDLDLKAAAKLHETSKLNQADETSKLQKPEQKV